MKLLDMIANALDYYRFEGDCGLPVDLVEVDVTHLLNNCCNELQAIASEKQVNIVTHLGTELPKIKGDAGLLARAFQNLVGNAVKYSYEDGIVSVRARKASRQLIIEIEDNGLGISPDEQLHLYEKFARGNGGRRSASSSGLGLYLSKKILDAHHATIICSSTQGEEHGTRFTIALPRAT